MARSLDTSTLVHGMDPGDGLAVAMGRKGAEVSEKPSDDVLSKYRSLLRNRVMTRKQVAGELGCSERTLYVWIPKIGEFRGPPIGARYRKPAKQTEVFDYEGLAAQRRAQSNQRRQAEQEKREKLRQELESIR